MICLHLVKFVNKAIGKITTLPQTPSLLTNTDNRVDKQLEKAEKLFAFARDAKKQFENKDPERQKQILVKLGSSLLLKDKKLSIQIPKPLLLIEKTAQEVRNIHQRLEPLKNGVSKRQLGGFYAQSPILLGGQDSNLHHSVQSAAAYH